MMVNDPTQETEVHPLQSEATRVINACPLMVQEWLLCSINMNLLMEMPNMDVALMLEMSTKRAYAIVCKLRQDYRKF
ncbi:hypothetical protein KIN20_001338 [Parelaphostrongylus tenuis]|uniref:Uncharacterized protein n=1 Tax=Parelaphostrongylus tenuis TaxID=148309 RepID=A0AAD5QCJ9_PARTN|nr:hypothetical protein KIN20_001338 [Parelaphostrongylus tenuis]